MAEVAALHPAAAALAALSVLVGGGYLAAALNLFVGALVAGRPVAGVWLEPLRSAALLLRQETASTERPDALLWAMAPAAYAAAGAAALCVVPLGESTAIADARTGIVVFGAAEALAIVAIFMHGWASNSHLSLIGGFRFVAAALSYELLSMFALIAAALPAESLQVSEIVRAQSGLWNVIRQPLGLPLWIIVTLGVTFWGPMNFVDGDDLAGGSSLEASGRQRLLWRLARGGMLTVFCLMGSAVFLGGWLGPVFPGWLWILVKTLSLMAVVLGIGHWFGRISAERAVTWLWTVGLPVSFAGLLWAGIEALL